LKKLAYLDFQCHVLLSYSPDLAPSDYHLFPELEKQLKGRPYSSDAEVIAVKDNWLDGQTYEFF
jgi:histone-lysine N-methyltransferase SETMAR